MFSSGFGHLWKKTQTTQTRAIASPSGLPRLEPTLAYSPQRPVAFAFGELLPQPLCGRLFQIWDDIIGYFNSSSAAPKRLREQLASGTSESDELRSRQAASVWSAFFPVGTEMGKYHSKNVGSENLFF